MIFSVFQKNLVLGYSWSTLPWYWCYYPYWSRDALSPVCGIFLWQKKTKGAQVYSPETWRLRLQIGVHTVQCNWICRLGRYTMPHLYLPTILHKSGIRPYHLHLWFEGMVLGGLLSYITWMDTCFALCIILSIFICPGYLYIPPRL